ncbi:MAG: SusD/RagB family nutrient-binding outer membrane lipoprotein [Prevotellaceae bacterium]|jgi:hypothetical protein|nr:SusD/RagB family nutrient-binding outer membrane lipoprotein [Prevotellaceae bacterium]
MTRNIIRQLTAITVTLTAIAVFSRCTDEDFSSKYPDPSKISNPTCDKFMTGVFNASRGFTGPAHDGFNWGHRIGVFAQTFGTPNSSPYSFDSYGSKPEDRWNAFYSSLINFRALENLYSKMDASEKAENDLFLWAAKIFIYHQLSEILVIWGDAPFTQASTLLITGNIKESTPKYDTQKELFTLILADLKTLSDNLRTATLSDAAKGKMTAQDYINGGNVLKWRMYANSLRLRLGMLLSSHGDLQNEGKAAVAEILGNEAIYPLPSDNSNMIAYFSRGTGDLRFEDLGKNDESRILGWASHAHVSRMVADGDPRLPVMYDPQAGTADVYVGFDPSVPFNNATDGMTSSVKTKYSRIDSASFIQKNEGIPAVLFSATEIWLLKAEAYQRSIVSGNAEEAFKKAVDQSVKFYYTINASSTVKNPIPLPEPSVIDAFVNARWNAYPSKEEAIATQKWLHLGFLQQLEAWTELRRTGLPRLFYSIDQGATSSVSRSVPNRLRYPDSERTYNEANCPRIENDKFETVLLWANPDWHDEGVVR